MQNVSPRSVPRPLRRAFSRNGLVPIRGGYIGGDFARGRRRRRGAWRAADVRAKMAMLERRQSLDKLTGIFGMCF